LLDDSLKGLGKDYKLYHFVLPAPHVLLTPEGPLVIVVRLERGEVSVTGEKWKQKMSAWRILTFLGREGLGNPTREARYQMQQVERLISEQVDEPIETTVDGVVAFLADEIMLNVEETPIPILRGAKLKGFLRSRPDKVLPRDTYAQLETIFDSGAGHETEEN
jgi:hypothetical protein